MAQSSILKILQSQGFGSRKECRGMLAAGRVAVRGVALREADQAVETDGLVLDVDGVSWPYLPRLYLALNKGRGYECSARPTHHPSVLELFPDHFVRRGLQSAGRLDWDTRGLLVLSDDGPFLHALSTPKRHVPKTYLARTARDLTDEQLRALNAGVLLRDEEEPIRPLDCRRLGERELELTIAEGKYHQIKRMIAAAGNHCESLERTAVGALHLDALNLPENGWRVLEARELELLGVRGC